MGGPERTGWPDRAGGGPGPLLAARVWSAFLLSLSLLTVYPVRVRHAPSTASPNAADDAEPGGSGTTSDGGLAVALAPLAGLAVWLPAALLSLAAREWLSYDFGDLVPAAVAVAAVALGSRGLHLDGLADIGDALGSYRSPEQAREVMRRGDVGPLGVVTVLFVVLVQVSCLEVATARHHGTVGLLVGVVTGRAVIAAMCVRGTLVAPGSRLGAFVIGQVSRAGAVAVVAGSTLLCAAAGALDIHTAHRARESVTAAAAPLVALALLWPLRRHLVRRLDGLGGDALGAMCELGVMIGLLVMAGAR